MIKGLRIVNFKRFRDVQLPLGELTVLTGSNGSGKTSLLHSLLLVERAALAGAGRTVALNDERGLQLGEGYDVLNWDAAENTIEIEHQSTTGTRGVWKFAVPDERSLHLPLLEWPSAEHGETSPFPSGGRNFTYISAERLGPRDTLGASSVSIDELGVGSFGEYVAQVLVALDRVSVSAGRRIAAPDGEIALADLLHQTEWWTRRIVRPIKIEAKWFPNSMVTHLRFKTPDIRSEWTRPPNMGFGVSYALPVIVAGLIAPRGGLLVIENPEAHLHPAGQSAIGRFLARVAADGVQVIVETHSDHVLNGVRHAVADPAHPFAADQSKVMFFLPEEDSRGVFIELQLSDSGAVSGWPDGFFDQIDRDLRELARLQRTRGRTR